MSAPPKRAPGFTLIEVMVALVIMAILAALAFRGIDALVHAKDSALAATDRTLKLNTGMSQFEYDVSQIVNSGVLTQPVTFDGSTLRFARRSPNGLQLVAWSLQDHRWQRWASPPVTRIDDLQEAWMRTQQWDSISGNAVSVLEDVTGFECNLYNTGGWSNCQSTQASGATGFTATGIRIALKLAEGDLALERLLPPLK